MWPTAFQSAQVPPIHRGESVTRIEVRSPDFSKNIFDRSPEVTRFEGDQWKLECAGRHTAPVFFLHSARRHLSEVAARQAASRQRGAGKPAVALSANAARAPVRHSVIDKLGNGRGDRIRTYDLRYPKPSRYQAAPRPDRWAVSTSQYRRRKALIVAVTQILHRTTPQWRDQSADGAAGRRGRCPNLRPCRRLLPRRTEPSRRRISWSGPAGWHSGVSC